MRKVIQWNIEFLLSLETINVNSIDNDGNSPLFYACLNGNRDIAEMLATQEAMFQTNETKLADILCQKVISGDLASIELFDKAGANLEIANYDKRTCGHVAAAEQNQEILAYLSKDTKFNFELQDRWGRSVLDEITDENLHQTIKQYYISNERNK